MFWAGRRRFHSLFPARRVPCPTASVAAAVALVVLLQTNLTSAAAATPDYVTDEKPPPTSAAEDTGLVTEGFEDKAQPPPPYDRRRKALEEQFPFLRGSTVSIKPRTYYFDRQRQTDNDSVAWALGGSIDYLSGWWLDERLRVGSVLYTSQKLYGPEDEDGTQLLLPGQRSFSVLGQLYLEAKLTQQIRAQLGRTTFNLPYLNKDDGRMVPNTFEALGIEGKFGKRFGAVLAQVSKIKERDSDEFVYMSEAAGYPGTKEPVTLLAGRYSFTDNWNIGATNQYGHNFLNTFYAETNAAWTLPHDFALSGALQFTDQRSVGNALGGEFDTHVYGGKLSGSFKRAVVSLAFSRTGSGRDITNPFGGYPGYLSMMIENFNRAEEQALLVGLSYNFRDLGLPGLSFFTKYAEGSTPDHGNNASPDQKEWDFTVDYRFQGPGWDKLWLRLRRAHLDQTGPGAVDVDDTRVILNYDWRLF